MTAAKERPLTQAATVAEELPRAQAATAAEELPRAQAATAAKEMPCAQAATAAKEMPHAQAATAAEELPRAQAATAADVVVVARRDDEEVRADVGQLVREAAQRRVVVVGAEGHSTRQEAIGRCCCYEERAEHRVRRWVLSRESEQQPHAPCVCSQLFSDADNATRTLVVTRHTSTRTQTCVVFMISFGSNIKGVPRSCGYAI